MNLFPDTLASRTHGDLTATFSPHSTRKAAELQAVRLQELGAQMAKMAHDLNNLLSPILMSLDVFRPHLEEASLRGLLDIAVKSAHRASDLVRQVVSFSRGAAEEREAVDPAALMKEIGALAQATLPGSIGVRLEIPDAMPKISGNATELHRALLNLCTNARDAMPEGGTLVLRATTVVFDRADPRQPRRTIPARHVLFEVGDTGNGIPEKIREKIFEPFFSTKAPSKGTGLGLASVRSVVENHAGVLSLQTEEGRGTTFFILIPTAECGLRPQGTAADLRIVPA